MNGDVGEPRAGSVQQGILTCQEFLCGTNSPQIAEFGFWDLNLAPAIGTLGMPNIRGLQLYAYLQGGEVYLPNVFAGRLTASRVATVPPYNTITLAGSGLIGGVLLLVNQNRLFEIRVSEVGMVNSWATTTGGTRPVLESYKLDWAELVNGNWGDFRNVCKNPPGRDNGDALTMTGNLAFHTLLFEGDRIDSDRKLDTGIDTTWFNLGCAGSALAKMALTGHTQAAHDAQTFDTTLPERQAMLKMLAADYCGTGMPFTVAGQPLNWRDDRGTLKLIQQPAQLSLEARWTANGPVCLNKPRVDIHPTALSNSVFGANVNIYNLVQSICPQQMPPQCADGSLEVDGYHLVSATPM